MAETSFAGDDAEKNCCALLGIAFYGDVWRWVQSWCLRLARHPHGPVRGIAALCLGHLARIDRQHDLDIALPLLRELATDPDASGNAENALADIEIFLQ